MAGVKLTAGDVIPEFRYDTPYQPQNSFYTLAGSSRPLFVVFLGNLGHPITRSFLASYAESYPSLVNCELACVVRSRPEVIAASLPRGTLPFELICDQEGILYRHFEIRQETNRFKCCSLEALRILRKAEKEGYKSEGAFQLPLTLVVARGGVVRMAHYGSSLTDVPADCEAMEYTIRQMISAWKKQREKENRRRLRAGEELPEQELEFEQESGRDFKVWGVDDSTLEFNQTPLTSTAPISAPRTPTPAPRTPTPAPRTPTLPEAENEEKPPLLKGGFTEIEF